MQCDKPRAGVSDLCTEQDSPISPTRNIWMFHNFGFPEPCLKPITDSCVPQHHKTELFRSAASLGGNTARTVLFSLGTGHTDRSKAPLLGLAQKLAHHGPLPSVPHHLSRTAAPRPLQSAPLPHRGGWWLAGAPWHTASAMGSLQQCGVGAVQPKGNHLEIPSWALSRTAHFTTDAAKPLTTLPPVLAFLSHSPPQQHCFVPSAR